MSSLAPLLQVLSESESSLPSTGIISKFKVIISIRILKIKLQGEEQQRGLNSKAQHIASQSPERSGVAGRTCHIPDMPHSDPDSVIQLITLSIL